MMPFNPANAFQQLRAESRREKEAALEMCRRKDAEWAADSRRRAALYQLMHLFPSDTAGCAVDVGRATARMIEYAQTLPAEWVKAHVAFVSQRLATLAADERPVPNACLKEILLNLLLLAREGDHAQVAAIFNEALRGDADDVDAFRLCLVNWLADKVVDGLPPLPDELKQPVEAPAESQEVKVGLAVAPTATAPEEWLPASVAVERAEQSGHPITLKWLTQDAAKHGVRIRPRQLPGRHQQEVEWNSLAGYLLKQARPETELDDEEISHRIRAAQEQKRDERSRH
jgi:hypothetical protein